MSRPQIFKSYRYSIAMLVVGCSFFLAPYAHALTISPARIEIAGDPGTTIGGEVTLINEQSRAETFYASYENFSAQGENGTPLFSADQTGLDTWMHVTPETVTVAPGQAISVPYAIAIPAHTEPGGYFAAIFWSTTPPTSQPGQVTIGAKIGLLVLLRVNGTIAEQAGITAFNRDGHSFFYTALPVTMQYTFRNEGGDRVEPVGAITIKDTLFLPAAHIDANAETGNILPHSARQFAVSWNKYPELLPVNGFFQSAGYEWHNFALGLYSARLSLVYGTQGLRATKTVWFFVIPWQLVLCVLFVLGIVWRAGAWLLSRYNRYIIRKAQQSLPHRDANHI